MATKKQSIAKPAYKPRRLYVDDKPHFGMESDNDYFNNNRELIRMLLKPYEEAEEAAKAPQIKSPPSYRRPRNPETE